MQMPIQIKILKSSSPNFWYSDRINDVVPVVRLEHCYDPLAAKNFKLYWVREGGEFNCLNIVLEQDCEVV